MTTPDDKSGEEFTLGDGAVTVTIKGDTDFASAFRQLLTEPEDAEAGDDAPDDIHGDVP